jgi:hypothetical protein
MLIKETIKFTGNDQSIKIPLSQDSNLNGLQDGVDDFIEEKTGLSINVSKDGETFKQNIVASRNFKFSFKSGTSFSPTLTRTAITNADLNNKSESVLRSFYVMQVYDNFDTKNQNLLHSSYYGGFIFMKNKTNVNNTNYSLNDTDEFTNLYIPNYYFDDITGNTTQLYARFYFYCAKDGKLHVFLNQENASLKTDQQIFFEINIDIPNNTYDFTEGSLLNIKESANSDYDDTINESINNQDNERPNYPSGTYFKINGGKGSYEDL